MPGFSSFLPPTPLEGSGSVLGFPPPSFLPWILSTTQGPLKLIPREHPQPSVLPGGSSSAQPFPSWPFPDTVQVLKEPKRSVLTGAWPLLAYPEGSKVSSVVSSFPGACGLNRMTSPEANCQEDVLQLTQAWQERCIQGREAGRGKREWFLKGDAASLRGTALAVAALPKAKERQGQGNGLFKHCGFGC
jgi:hypothetical protein